MGEKKGRASSVFGKENERPDPKKGVVGRLSAGGDSGMCHAAHLLAQKVPRGPYMWATSEPPAPRLWQQAKRPEPPERGGSIRPDAVGER